MVYAMWFGIGVIAGILVSWLFGEIRKEMCKDKFSNDVKTNVSPTQNPKRARRVI